MLVKNRERLKSLAKQRLKIRMSMLFLLVLLSVSFHEALAFTDTSQWLNIDCGAPAWTLDANLLWWDTDDKYISTGKNMLLSQSKMPAEMNTLRFFPQGDENCYSLPISVDARVLLRTGFYYGNYDNLSRPPKFDLHLDGYQWATITTSLAQKPVYHEVVYAAKGGSISFCLVRRDEGDVPFISTIEMVPLPADLYRDMEGNAGFYLRSRVNFGGLSDVRYGALVDEKYNRIWEAKGMPNYTNISALPPKISSAKNEPPLAVINTAVEAPIDSESLIVSIDLPPANHSVYIILYFMEPNLFPGLLNSRKFSIAIDGKETNDIVNLENDTCQVVSLFGVAVTGPTNVKLSKEQNSTLPPIINAMEVFTAMDMNYATPLPQHSKSSALLPLLVMWSLSVGSSLVF